MKKISLCLAGCSLAIATTQAIAHGYVVDSNGTVVRNAFNECWRTGFWTPADAIPECEPGMKKPEPPRAMTPPPPPPPKPAPVAVPAPAPVVVAPPPPPPPPPPKPKRIELSGAAQFAIGSSRLTDVGRADIDRDVIEKLKGFSSVDRIEIVGHTDPLGSASGNERLSQNRAAAVKEYLVSRGVDANVVTTRGVGSAEPPAGVDCATNQPRAKLVACYAAFRRITIDVDGVARP